MRAGRGRAWDLFEGAFWTALGAGLAVFGLAVALDQTWITVLAAAILAGLSLARLTVAVRRAGVDRLLRELRRLRTRVPIRPIAQVDPSDVGIDVPVLKVLPVPPGREMPRYVPRDVDAKLRDAIEAALHRRGPWIVVATGGPKVGKSRAMFEALRHAALDADLEFVAPLDANALRILAEEPPSDRRSVLWLDDLEPFLAEGLTVQTLVNWHQAVPECVIAATYGSLGGSLAAPMPVARLSAEILEGAAEVAVPATTPSDLDSLRAELPHDALLVAERHGLAAFLTAGPALVDKLTGRERKEGDCPEGVALVQAAIDWTRCGRTDPISRQALREAWPNYLRADTPVTVEGFEKGLEWALRPVEGHVALLKRRGLGFAVERYIVGYVDAMPASPPPPEAIWARAMHISSAPEALAVGARAYAYGSYRNALAAFRIASHAKAPWQYAAALFNTGVTLDKLGQAEEAIAVYTKVIEEDESLPGMRSLVGKALVNKGYALAASSHLGQAVATFDEVLRRYGPVSSMHLEVAKAILGRGQAFDSVEDFEKAIHCYDEAIERFGSAAEPELREQTAMALIAKGAALSEMGRLEEALEAYEETFSRYEGTAGADIPKLVAQARFNYGLTLATQGRSEDAIAVFDSIVARYGNAEDRALRDFADKAASSKNLAVGGLKRTGDDRGGDTEVIERANVAVAEGLRADFERNLREPVHIAHLRVGGLEFFHDSSWELNSSVNVLLGRNGYGKSLLLRLVAGMLQRDEDATGSLFDDANPGGEIELSLVRGTERGRIERDRSVFLRGSLGKVPLLAIPDARFMDRSTTTLSDPEALDLTSEGARHYLEQAPYQSAVEGLLSGLALDYLERKTFDLPSFRLINEVLDRLAGGALEFRRVERVGRTGSRIWVRTEGLDRDLEIQRASQGTLSAIAIFGLIHSFLQELAAARGHGKKGTARDEPAIVLIDEIDAHLHPVWQQKVRNTLVEIFPNVQFLLTAHSPLIVAGCGPREVSVLRRSGDAHEVQQLDNDFVGFSAQDLYAQIFDVEDLDENFLRYARLKESGEAEEIDRQLDELLEKERQGALSEKEEQLSERLALDRTRIARVDEVRRRRHGAVGEALKKEADIRRLEAELERERAGERGNE